MNNPIVVAIIITFNPDLLELKRLILSLQKQVHSTIIVDNGSSNDLDGWLSSEMKLESVLFIPLHVNLGIATALNRGIQKAISFNPGYFILFDHDSAPSSTMVQDLVNAAQQIENRGIRLAAVGPRYIDPRQDNPPPFIKRKGLSITRQTCTPSQPFVEVDYLISSGCLIPTKAIEAVGLMREDLFIDYVDIEWGLRALQMGYQSYGVCHATMNHGLGDQPIDFFGKKIPSHSPLRHYYLFRNAIALYRDPNLSIGWKIADGWRLLLKYIFYTIFGKPRHKHLSMMSKGILDGLLNRMGKLEQR